MDKDRQDLLMKFYDGSQERLVRWQAERATMTQIILAAVAALTAVIISSRTTLGNTYQYLGGVVTALGLIGFIFVQKYHERIQYYKSKMEKLREKLGDPEIIRIFEDAATETNSKYIYWSTWSIYKIYSALMVAIILYGLVVVVVVPHG